MSLNYKDFNDEQKLAIIELEYTAENGSFAEMATKYNTYSNRILRDAKRLGVHIRTRSEAQSAAIASGRKEHPTRGKKRSEESKN